MKNYRDPFIKIDFESEGYVLKSAYILIKLELCGGLYFVHRTSYLLPKTSCEAGGFYAV